MKKIIYLLIINLIIFNFSFGNESDDSKIKTWGRYLNKENEIPVNQFKAFYINTKTPKNVIQSELVDKVSIKYAWNDFHKIKSDDFGAYWVGYFDFEKDEKRLITINQSWAETRIIIDGKVVFNGKNSNNKLTHFFKKGRHKIEIEYINNWHTTDFLVNIGVEQNIYSRENAVKLLHQLIDKKTKLYYAGVYESNTTDFTVDINIEQGFNPIILYLSSYESLKWKINNPYNVNIKAIVYDSNDSSSSIEIDKLAKTKLIPLKNMDYAYKLIPTYYDTNDGYHKEGHGIITLTYALKDLLNNKKFDGCSMEYGANKLKVPNTLLNNDKYNEIAKKEKKIQREYSNNETTENLFD